MNNATLSLKVLVIDKSKDVVFKAVDKVIDLIKKSNLKHLVGPSETTIDGEINQLIDLLRSVFDLLKDYENSIFVSSQFYYNKNGITSMDEKIEGKN